jgi:protease II
MILPSLVVFRHAFARSGRNTRSLGSVRLHAEPLQHHKYAYQPRCYSFSSSTSGADPYDRYRTHTPSDSVLRELLEETKTTLQTIDSALYQQVRGEIQRAIEQGVSSDVPEMGPTGRFLYHFETIIREKLSVRQYRRVLADAHISEESNVDSPLPLISSELVVELDVSCSDLQAISLSADESMVAFVLNVFPVGADGDDTPKLELWVRHIETGRQIQIDTRSGTAADTAVSVVEFGPQLADCDLHTLTWVTLDEGGRPCTAHVATVDPTTTTPTCSQSEILYHSEDPTVHVDVQRCKGCCSLAVHARTQTKNQTFLMGPWYAETGLQLVRPWQEGVQYHLDVGTKQDVILMASRSDMPGDNESGTTQAGLGVEYSVWETSIDALPINDDWGTLAVVPKTGYIITDMDVFEDFIAVYERSTLDGRQRIRVTGRLSSAEEWIVPLPVQDEYVAVLSPGGNMRYQSDKIRFFLESPAEPRRTYEYHVPTRTIALLSEEAKCGDEIVQERTVVSSQDGTLVPLTFVYRKSMAENDERQTLPVVLAGYGAYGQSVNLAFDPTTRPLLDRGFVLAYAHTRGGGELGNSWHQRGKLYEKDRAVEDYVACAEALTGYLLDKPVRLVAKAFSAGGVVVGAAVNRRPDLFCGVVLTNAFLDVEATMQNQSLHLTQHEWEEYGNPVEDSHAAESIASYCPVANVADDSCSLPGFLLVGTLDDREVPVWNPLVYGKKMREMTGGKADILIYVEGKGGHQLLGTRSHIATLEVAFIISTTS